LLKHAPAKSSPITLSVIPGRLRSVLEWSSQPSRRSCRRRHEHKAERQSQKVESFVHPFVSFLDDLILIKSCVTIFPDKESVAKNADAAGEVI